MRQSYLTSDNLATKVKSKEITPKEDAKQLGISIDKYYRLKNKLQKTITYSNAIIITNSKWLKLCLKSFYQSHPKSNSYHLFKLKRLRNRHTYGLFNIFNANCNICCDCASKFQKQVKIWASFN